MGQYNKAILTAAGENLIARTLAGEIQLNITKAKTSNYIYPAGTDFKLLTDMQGIKQTVIDPATAVYNDTMIQTRVLFSNEEIASTYYIHNIGLYAMNGTQEVLFCIVTAETPDEMPQYNGVASTSYIYNIQNVVQDAAQLNITVNLSGTATIQDVLERVDATGGDISETVIETLDTVEDKYPVPAAGESVKRFFGKVLTFLRNIRPLTGDITIYVSTTGSDITGDGTHSNPFKTITRAIDRTPKNLNGYTVEINLSDGTYTEDVIITGFSNGYLVIHGNETNPENIVIQGITDVGLRIRMNMCSIKIVGINPKAVLAGSTQLVVYESSYVFVYECLLDGASQAQNGIVATGTTMMIVETTFNNCSNCIRVYKDDTNMPCIIRIGACHGINNGRLIHNSKAIIQLADVVLPQVLYANIDDYGGVVVNRFGANIGTLTYDLTLYVATTGADITGDGTQVNPFKTIQHAIDILPKDLGGYAVIINVADGTYNEDVRILGFHSGEIYIRTSMPGALNQNTKINTAYVKNCDAFVSVEGFQLLGTNDMTVVGIFCRHVRFQALTLATTPATGVGIFVAETGLARIYNCNINGRNFAIRFNNSSGYISTCSGTSNNIGMYASSASIIYVVGATVTATTPRAQENGGMFINQNGTQISELITSGLSCTWGTITGGYIRHGNLKGFATIIVQIRIETTANLNANVEYTVNGLPQVIGSTLPSNIPLTTHIPKATTYCYLRNDTGAIVFKLSEVVSAGQPVIFGGTYITNS